MFSEIKSTEWFQCLEVIGVIIPIMLQVYQVYRYSRKKIKKISKSQKKRARVQDSVLLVLNIIFGFILPAYFLWHQLNQEFSWFGLAIEIVCGYLILSNIILWCIVLYALHLLKDTDD